MYIFIRHVCTHTYNDQVLNGVLSRYPMVGYANKVTTNKTACYDDK